jgi:hypothetical protein
MMSRNVALPGTEGLISAICRAATDAEVTLAERV